MARCAVTDVELFPDATVIWPSHAWMSAMTKAAAARATTERCARYRSTATISSATTRSPRARAKARCHHSIQAWVSLRAGRRPWQSGQSVPQPMPESVLRVTAPMTTTANVTRAVMRVSRWKRVMG